MLNSCQCTGMQAEFFTLLAQGLFDPAHGMFTCNEETR